MKALAHFPPECSIKGKYNVILPRIEIINVMCAIDGFLHFFKPVNHKLIEIIFNLLDFSGK